jgi:hypothetical protein
MFHLYFAKNRRSIPTKEVKMPWKEEKRVPFSPLIGAEVFLEVSP